MITGNFEMQLIKDATDTQINNLLAVMDGNGIGEIESNYDKKKGCTVIEAFYEDKYTDSIKEVFKLAIVEKASAYLYDDGEKSNEPGDFKINKENGVIKEESPVILSDVSTECLIQILQQRGVQVLSNEKSNKKHDDLSK